MESFALSLRLKESSLYARDLDGLINGKSNVDGSMARQAQRHHSLE